MLELAGITKSYGSVAALSGVDLEVEPGEIVALAGPSGAGKTTTLHIAAGVLAASGGTVRLGGRDVTKVPAWKRNVALVQESYALYPHFTVFENIAFPLRSPLGGSDVPEQEIESRIGSIADVLEIRELLKNRIQHLSGGQRQRVALARALVREPEAFLLDEPIAHLDAKLRHWLRGELRRRLMALGRPTIWATPDGKEALSVADRVGVIVEGRVVQFGEPQEIFSNPATARVAEVVSEPPISLLKAEMARGPSLRLDGVERLLPIVPEDGTSLPSGRVLAGVRPSNLRLTSNGAPGVRTDARVIAREFTTRETVLSVDMGGQSVRLLTEPFSDFRVDERVGVEWSGARVYLFEADQGRKTLCHTRVVAGGGRSPERRAG